MHAGVEHDTWVRSAGLKVCVYLCVLGGRSRGCACCYYVGSRAVHFSRLPFRGATDRQTHACTGTRTETRIPVRLVLGLLDISDLMQSCQPAPLDHTRGSAGLAAA
jgi:hypothetical protein